MKQYPKNGTSSTLKKAAEGNQGPAQSAIQEDEHPAWLDEILNDESPVSSKAFKPPDNLNFRAHALWLHDYGFRIGEDKPRSKHTAKYHPRDDGARRSRNAIKAAWKATPDANVAIRLGPQRDPEVIIACLDADGAKALAYVRDRMPKGTPCCMHPSADGAKFLVRLQEQERSCRIMIPGCTNEGHDGLECLVFGKKATVAPGIHPDGDRYEWTVPLPERIEDIPSCSQEILDLPKAHEVKRNVGDGELVLTDDLEIRSDRHGTMTTAEWREYMQVEGKSKIPAVFNPFREDRRHTGFLALRGNSLRYYDSADSCWYYDDRLSSRVVDDGDPSGESRTDAITATFGHTYRFGTQYVPEGLRRWHLRIVEARMVALKAAIGTGKTTAIMTYLKDLSIRLRRPVRTLVLTHRQSLTGHLVTVYELTTDYRDIQDKGGPGWNNVECEKLFSLGICVDSVCRFGGTGKLASRLVDADPETMEIVPIEYDLVIIDEAESVFRHLHGGTLKGRSHGVWRVLRRILRTHTKVTILADAHLSDYAIGEYRAMVGSDPGRDVLIEGTWKRGRAKKTQWSWCTRDEEFLRERVLVAPRLMRVPRPEDLEVGTIGLVEGGLSVYIANTREAESRRLWRKLKTLFPDKRILLVTGRHDDPEGEKWLADPNGYMQQNKVDVLIATTAVESGVSIDVDSEDAFDVTVLFGWGDHVTWQDLIQMVGRPRHLQRRWILAWVQEHGPAPWTFEKTYAKALLEATAKTDSLLLDYEFVDGKVTGIPDNQEHFDAHVRTVVHECRSRLNLARDFWSYWEDQMCEVVEAPDKVVLTDDQRKDIRKEKAADREAIKRERANRMAAMDTQGVTVEEARKTLDRKHTAEEGDQAMKVLIEHFYGRKATPDLILADDDGKTRRMIRDFNAVRAVARGELGIRKVLSVDAKSADKATADRSHHTIRAALRWLGLDALGVTSDMLEGEGGASGPMNVEGLLSYLRPPANDPEKEPYIRPAVQRQYKLHLGISVENYLEPGRSRGRNGTGLSLVRTNGTPVPPVPSGPDGVTDDSAVMALTDDDLTAAGRAWARRQCRPPQVMSLARQIARQIGLKFMKGRQIRSGPDRGKRVVDGLDPDSVKRMLDLGAADWERLWDEEPVDEIPDLIAELFAA